MNFQSIKKLQKDYGFDEMQNLINSGTAWKMEGSFGRQAMELLNSGACMLPKSFKNDYYGNRIPSRDVLKAGSKGTYQNSKTFWEGVQSGRIDLYGDEDCF
tara:strand:- start:497 stop:799 length:303 start_codon:yes stop_codon:yes gene_type:complete